MHNSLLPFRLYIFDADNTLRRTTVSGKPCPHAPDEWELLPGVRSKLATLRWGAGGALLGIASNQDQVAYGHLTERMARRLLEDMVLAAFGPVSPPPAIRFCPHALELPCGCRKPAPGMLLSIMDQFGIAPGQTVFIGDAPVDQQAARRARVRFVWAQVFFGGARLRLREEKSKRSPDRRYG